MLKQRVITALILLPLILGPIFYFPTHWLYVFLCLPGLIGAWEWTALMGLTVSTTRYAYLALVAAFLALAWLAEPRIGKRLRLIWIGGSEHPAAAEDERGAGSVGALGGGHLGIVAPPAARGGCDARAQRGAGGGPSSTAAHGGW